MTKYCLITDTHLGQKTSEKENQLTYNLFEEICSLAKNRNIKNFIHLGDLFHGRTLSYRVLDYAHKIGTLLSETFKNSFLVVGNHDIQIKNNIYPNGVAPLFNSFSNIQVIEEPIKLNNEVTIFPWITDDNINQLKEVNTDILMGHFGINDIQMNRSGTLSENEPLNISDFRRFELVLSGHFHLPSINGNIKYLGSPYHMNFNDTGDRGFYIFDSDSRELEFIKFDAPQFKIFNIEKDELTEEEIYGNNIRLDFPEKKENTEIEKLIRKVEDLGAISVKTKFNFQNEYQVEENKKDVSELSGNKEIMNNYLESVEIPEEIDRNKLKKVMNNIFEESEK